MYNDPIADLLTRIRNGQMRKKFSVTVRGSKEVERILKVLLEEGFIASFDETRTEKGFLEFSVQLKYFPNGKPAITSCTRVSKGGRRVYKPSGELGKNQSGLGISIVSTSKGVMTDRAARKLGVGGEVIAAVS